MYALAPKLTALNGGKVEANATPIGNQGDVVLALLLQLVQRPVHQRRQDAGPVRQRPGQVATWDSINKGFTSKFWGPSGNNSASDLDGYLIFNQGLAASELGIVNGLGQAQSGNVKDYKATISKAAAAPAVMPGIQPDTTGSIIVTEGWGVGAFSKNQEAAVSLLNYMTGPVYQPQMLAEIGVAGQLNARRAGCPSSTIRPSRRSSRSRRSSASRPRASSSGRACPTRTSTRCSNQAISNLYKGTWTPQQCKDETVKATKDLITKWLTS